MQTGGPCPATPLGGWALLYPAAVRQQSVFPAVSLWCCFGSRGSVGACHSSVTVTARLNLPVRALWSGRPLADRYRCPLPAELSCLCILVSRTGASWFLIISPSPQSPPSRIGDDLVTLLHVLREAGPELLLAPASSCCRLLIAVHPESCRMNMMS